MPTDRARPIILFVDDERALSQIYLDICAEEGWDGVCWTGPSSPEAVASLRPSLILTDLVFAGDRGRGRAFVDALMAAPETAGIPIIVCSADARQLQDAQPWIAQHACSRLEKPFDLDVLVAEVRRCLGERGPQDTAPQPYLH